MLRTDRLSEARRQEGISLGVFRTFGDTALVEGIEMLLPNPSKKSNRRRGCRGLL
jgi:hypothetical protein